MNGDHKKLVMFDFDGVLIDTLGICYDINIQMNENLSLDEYKGFFEGNINNSIRVNGEPRIKHPDFFNQYDLNTRDIIIPQVLKKIVKDLSQNYILTIVSSTGSSSIKSILEREGISEHFRDLLGNDVHPSKVVKIRMLLKKYGVDPKDSVFITDTLGDIKEASECDVGSIAVTWGFHDIKTLQKGNPEIIIDDPTLLEGEIKMILK